MHERLHGLVARVLNEREVAINIGSLDGASQGMKFKILSRTPMEIRDPETDEILGVEDQPKVRVQATRVEDRYSICATYEVKRIPGGPLHGQMLGGAFSEFAELTRPPEEYPVTLRFDRSEVPPPLSPEESYVKAGDRVIQILPSEELGGY